MNSSSLKCKSRVVTSGLKNVFAETKTSTCRGRMKLNTAGNPLIVTLGSKIECNMSRPRWDHESLIKLQTANNLSDKYAAER